MRDRVTVLAPAKLNLALDVVGILPGGYHALDMTMQLSRSTSGWSSAAVPTSIWPCPAAMSSPARATPPSRRRWLSSTIRACWRVQTSPSIRASPSGPVWPAAAPTLRPVLVGLNELYGAVYP